jgi:hypothetical protein
VSAEAFSFLRTEDEEKALREFFHGLDGDIHSILVRRSVEDWRASATYQLEKSGYFSKYKSLQGEENSINGDWYFDWSSLVNFWQALGPVKVVDYEAALVRDNSIIPSIIRAIGIDEVPRDYDLWLNARKRGGRT